MLSWARKIFVIDKKHSGTIPIQEEVREYVFVSGSRKGMHLHCARISEAVEYVHPVTKEHVLLVDERGYLQNFPGIQIEDHWVSGLKNEKYLEPKVRFCLDLEAYDEDRYLVLWEVQPDGRYWEDEDGFGGTSDCEIRLYTFLHKTGHFEGPFRIYNVGDTSYFK